MTTKSHSQFDQSNTIRRKSLYGTNLFQLQSESVANARHQLDKKKNEKRRPCPRQCFFHGPPAPRHIFKCAQLSRDRRVQDNPVYN